MGRTSNSGPLYGARTCLAVVAKDTVATNQTNLEVFEIDVPATEDWFITRVTAYCDDAGSTAAQVDVEDDGTSVLTANITLVSDDSVASVPTTTTGEDEGAKVAAGSVLTVDVTTGTTSGPADIVVQVWGYARYIGGMGL